MSLKYEPPRNQVSVSTDASTWTPVDAGLTFTGNVDGGDAVVKNTFAAAVTARYVRIEPVTWENSIAMRAGVYACTLCQAGTYSAEVSGSN